MNVDGKKNVEVESASHEHSVRDIPLDKLKALLLSKAELILSTLTDNILNSVVANKSEFQFHTAVCMHFSFDFIFDSVKK